MRSSRSSRYAAICFLLAAVAFFAASALGRQPALAGVGVAFLAIGAARLRKAPRATRPPDA